MTPDRMGNGCRTLGEIDTSTLSKMSTTRLDEVKQSDRLDNVKEDRTDEDLLFKVLVDRGVDLTLPIRRETLQGKMVFFVDDNALVACLERGVTEDLVKELAGHEPCAWSSATTASSRMRSRPTTFGYSTIWVSPMCIRALCSM